MYIKENWNIVIGHLSYEFGSMIFHLGSNFLRKKRILQIRF